MQKKVQRDLIILGVLICVAAFFYFTKNFWRQQLRIYITGRVEVVAEDYGINLPKDIDTIEVFTLQPFTFENGPNQGVMNGFLGDYSPGETTLHQYFNQLVLNTTSIRPLWKQPILPAEQPMGTFGHKTLTGAEAKEIIDLWRYLPVGRDYQAMCFEPAYGLQFKRKGKIYFQTSVCWHCSGYTLPIPPFGTVQYGFDAKSKGAQMLLKILESHLPLLPDSKNIQRQKIAAGITNS